MTAPTQLDAAAADSFLIAMENEARLLPYSVTYALPDARTLTVRQDAAARDPKLAGGLVFEFWYDLASALGTRGLTRREARALLRGEEPAAPTSAEDLFARIARQEAQRRG